MRSMVIYTVAGLALILLLAIFVVRMNPGKPRESLGLQSGRLAPCPESPNCVCSQDEDGRHVVAPFPMDGDAFETMECLKRALASLPGARIVSFTKDYVHAECTSRVFGFVDDVECYVDATAGVIHVRSASRMGYSDLGVNRRRVETLRAVLASLAEQDDAVR